jgi:hypothetical protein
MASALLWAWYLEGSGVPVGWNEGAVALRVVGVVLEGVVGVAMGAMVGRYLGLDA